MEDELSRRALEQSKTTRRFLLEYMKELADPPSSSRHDSGRAHSSTERQIHREVAIAAGDGATIAAMNDSLRLQH